MSSEVVDQQLVDKVVTLSHQAGDAIMAVYRSLADIEVDYKADNSPLTEADLAAHQLLVPSLQALLPGVPVLSEESNLPPFAVRSQWRRYWLIDPLDGTKEFISRNGEFTVNVALIENGRPVLGVVHVPVQTTTYTGARGIGAAKISPSQQQAIAVRSVRERLDNNKPIEVVASRRHGSEQLQKVLDKLQTKFGAIETVNMGSSLKFCLIAEGRADFYPRLAPTSEWDTGAAQAVLEAAGGQVVDSQFRVLGYNQKADILNPFFYAWGDQGIDWQGILA